MSGSKTKEPWTTPEDLLERKQEADFLENYLKQASNAPASSHGRGSFVINLKGQWGTGKTYFLENFAQQLRNSNHKVVEFDAWRADPDVDPLISLIAAIKTEIEPDLKKGTDIGKYYGAAVQSGGKLVSQISVGLTKRAAKYAVGEAFEEIAETFKDSEAESWGHDEGLLEKARQAAEAETKSAIDSATMELAVTSHFAKQLKSANSQKAAIKAFSNSFEKIAKTYAEREDCEGPFYIFVDELDRCRPTFAIEVLERINHLFDVEGVVFVVGTDSDELEHSIKAVYGSEFDSRSYLNRFFSFTYNLATPKTTNYIEYLIELYALDMSKFSSWDIEPNKHETYVWAIERILGKVIQNIRDYRHIFFMVKTFEMNWKYEIPIDLYYVFACATAVFYKQTYLLRNPDVTSKEMEDESFKNNWNSIRLDEQNSINSWVNLLNAFEEVSVKKKLTTLQQRKTNEHLLPLHYYLIDILQIEAAMSNGNKFSYFRDYIHFMETASRLALNTNKPD